MNQPTSNGNPHDLIDHSRFVGRTRVAYFSMEIAISPEMPTYSGAHGILAEVQAAQTVWVSPTRHIQCGPNAWEKRVGLASVVLQLRWERRPSFMLGWAYHLEGGCSSQRFRSIGRSPDRDGATKTPRRIGCSSVGFGLLGRRTRQGTEIDNLSAVRIAAEKINAGLPPD
jgi:hypothetical protein